MNQSALETLGTSASASRWQDVAKQAGLDFEVRKEQLYHPRTNLPLFGTYGIFRTDNDAFLGVVGDRYIPIQNATIFSFLDSIIEDSAKYERAGMLNNGGRIFVVANLLKEHNIHNSGDVHKAFLTAIGSHDGSTSVRIFCTDFRIICSNTIQLLLRRERGNGVSVKHTNNGESNMYSRLRSLEQVKEQFSSTMEKLEFLAEKKINSKVVDTVIEEVFGIKNGIENASSRVKGSVELVKELLERNDNNAFPQFRGTAYNLLNAVTEFYDHHSEVRMTDGRVNQTKEILRAESSLFGRNAEIKANALEIILANAQQLATISQHKTYSLAKQKESSVLEQILNNN